MNIWLIMSGEPLEQFGERPHRVGILSKILVEKGHKVTWWTTSFDHQHKKYFYNKDTEITNEFGVDMVFLHSNISYIKNISYNRIKNHKEVANRFYEIANKKEKPDIILCAFPTIDLAYEAVKYSKKYHVPVVIDIRDLWPKIFFNPFPKFIHPFIKIVLSRYINQTEYIFKNCSTLTAVSKNYLDYGLSYKKEKKSKYDEVFPLAYNNIVPSKHICKKCESLFGRLGVDTNKIIVWFVGTFGQTYDLSPIIKVAKKLKNRDNLQFVFTGDGEKMQEWKRLATDSSNIIFTGWVKQNELSYLGSISNIGLMAYKKDAPQGLPNKIFEYLASGLVILSSLENETKDLLENEKVGLFYQANDSSDFEVKLLELVENNELLNIMSNNALNLFNNNYSAKIVYGNMIDYLEKISKNYNKDNK